MTLLFRTALLASLLAAMVAPGSSFAGKADDTLVYVSDEYINNISPYHNNTDEGAVFSQLIWDGLLSRSAIDGSVQPLLAASWKWAGVDAIDFRLRKDVKFHNGDPFTAEDVVFTVNYVLSDKARVTTPEFVNWIAGAEASDPYTVRIRLKKPFPAALDYLAMALPIFPKAYFEKAGGLEGFIKAPVGTGPYKVVSLDPRKGVNMVRNDDYFRNIPKSAASISNLQYRIIPEPQSRIDAIKSGDANWIWRIPADQAESLSQDSSLEVAWEDSTIFSLLQMNAKGGSPLSAPFKDSRVRRAVSMAIDRETLQSVFAPMGQVINSFCRPGQNSCDQNAATIYPFDLVAARKLLAEAGYPDGFDTELFVYQNFEYTQAVIEDLKKVGIRAKLRTVSYSDLISQMEAGRTPLVLRNWASRQIYDASAVTGVFFKGGQNDLARDKEIMTLLAEGDSTIDALGRGAYYSKALARISSDAYVLPLFTNPSSYVTTKDLNFFPQPDGLPRFYQSTWR